MLLQLQDIPREMWVHLKYYLLVGGKRDKHMVEHEHFNQQRAVQYYADIRNTLSSLFKNNNTKIKQCSIQ